MPRLQNFEVKIETGDQAMAAAPSFVINGFTLPFDSVEGGVGTGETFVATGRPDSFPHSLHLTGPDESPWDIASLSITYFPYGEEPYSLRFAPLTLDSESDLDIWQTRPEPVFDV